MMMADTSVWIDYVNGAITPQTNILDFELQENRIIVGDIIIAEFLQGFRDDKQFQQAKSIMDCLEYHDLVGKEMAYLAAKNYRKLRKQGITIRKTVDVLIATYCIEHGIELLHNDRDFDAMETFLGLRVRR